MEVTVIFKKGDWVRCGCSSGTCKWRGIVVEDQRYNRDVPARVWETSEFEGEGVYDELPDAVAYKPTEQDKLRIVKKLTAGELTL